MASDVPEGATFDDDDEEERHRMAARAYFRSAPPYCIQAEDDGRFSVRKKRYDYWEAEAPEASTTWRALSYHAEFEEAERRLQRITSPVSYYDETGRLAAAPRRPEPDCGVPDDD